MVIFLGSPAVTHDICLDRNEALILGLHDQLQDAIVKLYSYRCMLVDRIRCLLVHNFSSEGKVKRSCELDPVNNEKIHEILHSARLSGLVQIPKAVELVLKIKENAGIVRGMHQVKQLAFSCILNEVCSSDEGFT